MNYESNDDECLIYDMQQLNGDNNSTMFPDVWDKMMYYLSNTNQQFMNEVMESAYISSLQ